LQQWLDDWHYRVLHSSLAKQWPRNKVIRSALDILVLNGVNLTVTEYESYPLMPEYQMVRRLVGKMPESLRENFEHVSLQLQMVVTMATRLRKAIEGGSPEDVLTIVEESDGSGVGHQFLKRAVVVASNDISQTLSCNESWTGNIEKKLTRLQNCAEDSERCQQKLMTVEAQIGNLQGKQKSKGHKVLGAWAEGNEQTLLHSTFAGWKVYVAKCEAEKGTRVKFENRIAEANQKLFKCQEDKIKTIKAVFERAMLEAGDGLLRMCFDVFMGFLKQHEQDCMTGKRKSLETKLTIVQAKCAEGVRIVLSRMFCDTDDKSLAFMFAGWGEAVGMGKQDREQEANIKAAQKATADHQAKMKENSLKVVQAMLGASDSLIVQMMWINWVDIVKEAKKAKEVAEQQARGDDFLMMTKLRHNSNAHSVQDRINQQMELNLVFSCLCGWKMEAEVKRVDKKYTGKIESKRRQLNSVQTLFTSFARQLEEGLGAVDGDSSARGGKRRSHEGAHKEHRYNKENPSGMKESRSLPSISQKPGIA